MPQTGSGGKERKHHPHPAGPLRATALIHVPDDGADDPDRKTDDDRADDRKRQPAKSVTATDCPISGAGPSRRYGTTHTPVQVKRAASSRASASVKSH